MDPESIRTPGSAKLKRDLGTEAVNLAVQGEWQRATEVNKAILELFSDDVEAMNRLVKALIELGSYVDAGAVLDRVCEVAPYNNIAKKNRARLEQLAATPGSSKQAKKTVGARQQFIEETGKSGTTILRNTSGKKSVLHVAPSDQIVLTPENNTLTARTLDGQLLGQVEPKMGKRLARLIDGGNKYTAAVVAVNEQVVSIMIRETFKDRSLQNVCSFPSKVNVNNEDLGYRSENMARFIREDDTDVDSDADVETDEEEEEDDADNIIEEEDMDTDWSEDE